MARLENVSPCFYEISEKTEGEITILLKGKMDIETSASILKELCNVIKTKSPFSVTLDLGNVYYFDDFGALVLLELRQLIDEQKGKFNIINADSKANEILSLVNFHSNEKCVPPKRKRAVNILVRLGESAIRQALSIRYILSFIGSTVISFIYVCFHPRSLRIDDTITYMEKTGVEALPIVGLISFLLGLIMAFMSSIQLQQFGANIYVASLVALAMVSELGPIMTAIIVAGRSGSAFAAEIGTMKISEEVDALFVMGFNPTLFLVIPRIIASIIVVPLLTLFSDLFAIAGGLVVGVFMLGLTTNSYITQTIETLTFFEVVWGLLKSVVFAVLIAWTGCLRGFLTKGGADSVGSAATSAVVNSMFLIILFDSIFAVIRSYWR
ncbi:MAG: MlaE family lipid ABC transporter permease subunit [Desulfobacterales bacterium]|nr:MlaE family lipid ABC transporter permease subunit [Desulfobacterales bacterium]